MVGKEAPRYDLGMTMSKIAISLPKDQIARVHRELLCPFGEVQQDLLLSGLTIG